MLSITKGVVSRIEQAGRQIILNHQQVLRNHDNIPSLYRIGQDEFSSHKIKKCYLLPGLDNHLIF